MLYNIPHLSLNLQCHLWALCPSSKLATQKTSSRAACRMVCHRRPPSLVSWHPGSWACSTRGWVRWSRWRVPGSHGEAWRWARRLISRPQTGSWGSSLRSEGWGSGWFGNVRWGKSKARRGWSERRPKMVLFDLIMPDLSSAWQSSGMIARNTLPWTRWAKLVLTEIRLLWFPKGNCN